MESSGEQTLYQFYTIIDDPTNIIIENQHSQPNLQDGEEQGNQIVYFEIRQEDEEEEEQDSADQEENSSKCVSSIKKVESSENLPHYMSNIKLVTLENGEIYLTTDNSADNSLTAVQPHLLTNSAETVTSTDSLHLPDDETPSIEDFRDDISSFREIQLEDGTCAIITADLWNSLVENTQTNNVAEIIKKKKYLCHYEGCGKNFSTSHHLLVHQRIHTGSRPYECTEEGCVKAFATGYSLKAHLRTHTGEKPYGCHICFKRFKTSGDLQKHIRIHTGEKPFKCPIEGCKKSFTTSNIRKVHIRSHTGERPYTCKVEDCGKAFASATNFKNHMRIHSGEKPYVCHIQGCGKRFTEYSSLYKHHAVHQPYRNYRCEFCSQHFKFENTLRLHRTTVHNVVDTEGQFAVSDENARPFVLQFTDTNALQNIADPLLLSPEQNIDDEDK